MVEGGGRGYLQGNWCGGWRGVKRQREREVWSQRHSDYMTIMVNWGELRWVRGERGRKGEREGGAREWKTWRADRAPGLLLYPDIYPSPPFIRSLSLPPLLPLSPLPPSSASQPYSSPFPANWKPHTLGPGFRFNLSIPGICIMSIIYLSIYNLSLPVVVYISIIKHIIFIIYSIPPDRWLYICK